MATEPKYVLTTEHKYVRGCKVFRIRATRSFSRKEFAVAEGALGGWVEGHSSLSHDGTAWVDEDAVVCQGAWVKDAAWVGGQALLMGGAGVAGAARVLGKVKLVDVYVSGKTVVRGDGVIVPRRLSSASDDVKE